MTAPEAGSEVSASSRTSFDSPDDSLITALWNEFYDVSPDGDRFLVVVPVAKAAPRPISLSLTWAPEPFAESFPLAARSPLPPTSHPPWHRLQSPLFIKQSMSVICHTLATVTA